MTLSLSISIYFSLSLSLSPSFSLTLFLSPLSPFLLPRALHPAPCAFLSLPLPSTSLSSNHALESTQSHTYSVASQEEARRSSWINFVTIIPLEFSITTFSLSLCPSLSSLTASLPLTLCDPGCLHSNPI